jgi:hypothetical protein
MKIVTSYILIDTNTDAATVDKGRDVAVGSRLEDRALRAAPGQYTVGSLLDRGQIVPKIEVID